MTEKLIACTAIIIIKSDIVADVRNVFSILIFIILLDFISNIIVTNVSAMTDAIAAP